MECVEENNKHNYQVTVNTMIGLLRNKLAVVVISRNPTRRQKKLERIVIEIHKHLVQVSGDDVCP